MTANEDLISILREVSASVQGLRSELEGWRQHTASTGEFIMIEIDHLIAQLSQLEAALKPQA